MKGRFGFSVLEKLKLILVKIEYDYTLDDVVIFKQKYLSDAKFDSDYKTIYDLRKSNYTGTFDQIQAFVDWVVANKDVNTSKNSSFITDTPKQLVISKMITSSNELKNNNYEDHCTVEGALRYLSIELVNLEMINSAFKKMITKEL